MSISEIRFEPVTRISCFQCRCRMLEAWSSFISSTACSAFTILSFRNTESGHCWKIPCLYSLMPTSRGASLITSHTSLISPATSSRSTPTQGISCQCAKAEWRSDARSQRCLRMTSSSLHSRRPSCRVSGRSKISSSTLSSCSSSSICPSDGIALLSCELDGRLNVTPPSLPERSRAWRGEAVESLGEVAVDGDAEGHVRLEPHAVGARSHREVRAHLLEPKLRQPVSQGRVSEAEDGEEGGR
eukprot:766084-Hanusia_phi.AAC.2